MMSGTPVMLVSFPYALLPGYRHVSVPGAAAAEEPDARKINASQMLCVENLPIKRQNSRTGARVVLGPRAVWPVCLVLRPEGKKAEGRGQRAESGGQTVVEIKTPLS